MTLKRMTRTALLAAMCVVSRYLFGAFPNVKPITAIFFISSLFFGFFDGFLIMFICMLVTSFIFGFGIWVYFQIIAYTLILLLWTILKLILTKHTRFVIMKNVMIQGIVAGMLAFLYGFIIDFINAVFFHLPWWGYVLNGLTFNLAHSVSTILFYPLIFEAFRRLGYEENL